NDLLEVCRSASDVWDGPDRYDLARRVESELRLLFGDLLTTLPDSPAKDEPLSRSTRDRLSDAVIRMWTVPVCLTKTRDTLSGTETTRNVGLSEEVEALVQGKKLLLNVWKRLHPAHAAFVCLQTEMGEDGEVVEKTVLGMNAKLASSTRVVLPDEVNRF